MAKTIEALQEEITVKHKEIQALQEEITVKHKEIQANQEEITVTQKEKKLEKFFVIIGLLCCAYIVYIVAKKMKARNTTKPVPDNLDAVSEESRKEIKKWFCDEMQSFESKILAFCIDEELRNKKLSYELESELKKKYGNQSLMPLLYHMDLLEKLQRVSPTINQVTLDYILQKLIEEYWHDNFAPVGKITLDNLKEQMATLKKSEAEKIISALINK